MCLKDTESNGPENAAIEIYQMGNNCCFLSLFL